MLLLADGVYLKELKTTQWLFTMFIITDMIQVRTITDEIILLQSGGTLS